MEKIDVDLTSLTLLSNETETRLRKFKSAVQLNYIGAKTVASTCADYFERRDFDCEKLSVRNFNRVML